MDAYENIYLAVKNTEAFLNQADQYAPYAIKELRKGQLGENTAALNPRQAVINAVNSIAEERLGDYSAYLSSDAGFQDLTQRAFVGVLSPQIGNDSNFFRDFYNFYATPGRKTSEFIHSSLPPGPLTDILATTATILGDPLFLATLAVLPPAGLAAKGLLAAEIAGGMAAGEEGAEEVGLPPIFGALAGGIALPTLAGFTRAGFRAALERARANPEAGTPATEILRQEGAIVTGPEEIEAALGDFKPPPRVLYRGTSSLLEKQPLGEGAFLTPIKEDAEVYARTTARAVGGEPRVIAVEAAPDAIVPSQVPGIAAERGAVTVAKPEGIRVTGTYRVVKPGGIKTIPEEALPAMAGGENMLTPDLMDNMARAVFERPEAQDLLKKTAEVLADKVPGARLLIQVVDRMALTKDPHLGGAFRGILAKQWQDGQREVALASFRATKPPFIENAIGQIWLPETLGSAKGSWIAVGDVFESVMRGEATYLPRLAQEQVAWIKNAQRALIPFTKEAEAALGTKIATREVYWPRFVQDPTAGRWSIRPGLAGRARPPALFRRMFEEQQEAIAEHGLRYKPGVINQMDLYIRGMQRIARNGLVNTWWKQQGAIRIGRPTLRERGISELGFGFRGVMNKEQFREVATILGPGTRNPLITVPAKINAVFRLLLTGTADTGWGAIQLMSMPFSPAGPAKWAETMARGFYTMIINPREYFEFLAKSPAARRYAMYGGNVGLDTEFFEATRLLGESGLPVVGPMWNVASYPLRAFVRRLEVGFESSLAYGRILTFDAMADAARAPSLAARIAGAPVELAGEALHDELYRVARFTDTLLGQPRLAGIVSPSQMQFESAWVWFAARYTRSFLGTLSYVAGSGYTPAQARVIMAKMLLGGAAVMSGLIAGKGKAQGKNDAQILSEIATALNPMSGKKFMALPIGGNWYGMGGTYRSGFAMLAGLADKDNWNADNWEAASPGGLHLPNGIWDNPITRGWRSRGAPIATTLSDFLQGEDFLGYQVDMGRFVDNPDTLLDYFTDKYLPITFQAYLQGHGDWQKKLPLFVAEFFGLRTSPETASEALSAVRNRVSNQMYGVDYGDLPENNRVARQRVNDDPGVVAVIEGRVRPIQEKRVQTAWDKYILQSEQVRTTYGTQKEDLDTAARSGKLAGDDYRSKYSDLQRQEFGELTGLQKALGIEFEEREAPEGTVDAAIDAYFAVNLDDYTDPETKETDWEGFYADREASLAGLSDTDRADVDWYLSRHESELHRDFGKAFDEVIKPSGYLNVREVVSKALGVDLNTLKEAAQQALLERGARAGAADVWLVVDEILNRGLESRLGEDAPSLSDLRNALREANPRLDVELHRQGYVDKVRTPQAVALAQDLKAQYPDRAYFVPPLVQGAK
jgi:hypothetical protein